MFGMSFGNTAPQENKRDVLADNAEVFETLKEYGFVDTEKDILPADYEAIKTRMQVLQKEHAASTAVAMGLAYLDRKLFIEKGNEQAEARLLNAVGGEIISPLVDGPLLATNMEFLQTVANSAVAKYKEGAPTFSDALFAAVAERKSSIASTPVLDLKIDGQENVVQKSDEVPMQ